MKEILRKTAAEEEIFGDFLHENYIGFFTDCDDVAEAAEYFSCVGLLTDFREKDSLDKYIGHVAALGLSESNKHPAKSHFAKIFKPQLYNVWKSVRQRRSEHKLSQHYVLGMGVPRSMRMVF